MRYHVTYQVECHPDGLDRVEVPPNTGACSAIMVASILYPEDGSLGVLLTGVDGRTGDDLTPTEAFKVWTILAKRLSEEPNLDPFKREFCGMVFQSVCDALDAVREKN